MNDFKIVKSILATNAKKRTTNMITVSGLRTGFDKHDVIKNK